MLQMIKDLEEQRNEREKRMREAQEMEQETLKRRYQQTNEIEIRINRIHPLLIEANLMAKELKRSHVEFDYKLMSVIPEDIVKDPLESI